MAANSNPTLAAGVGSMSSVFTEMQTGCHVMKIERYSQTTGVFGVGNAFKSAVFIAGGHRWHIGYYPDGYAEDTVDFVGFELFLVDHPEDADDVTARFVFALLDKAGLPVAEYTAASEVGTFSRAVPSWGYDKFIRRTELESMYLNKDDDSFCVRCDVTVFKDSRREHNIAATPPPPPPPSRSCARVFVRLILLLILLVACPVMLGYIYY